jgi:hypothetical protein
MQNEIEDKAVPVRWIKIPLDAETADRLESLSDVCHTDPARVAASLLHDILADDAETHQLLEASAPSRSIN